MTDATQQLTPINRVCAVIASDDYAKRFDALLEGSGIPRERFVRTAITAIQANPDLADADVQSLYNAVTFAAQDNLLPNGREGAIVTFNTNVGTKQQPRWIKKAQFMPMVQGLIKRVGTVGWLIDAQLVHEADAFVDIRGDNPKLEHSPPKFGTPRGEIIGAYAIATDAHGRKKRMVMDRAEIEQVRECSRNKDGIWKSWFGQMALKTVIRRLVKTLPIVDYKLLEAIERDDEMYDFGDTKTEPSTPPPAPAGKVTRLDALRQTVAPEPGPDDAIDGEFAEVPGEGPGLPADERPVSDNPF